MCVCIDTLLQQYMFVRDRRQQQHLVATSKKDRTAVLFLMATDFDGAYRWTLQAVGHNCMMPKSSSNDKVGLHREPHHKILWALLPFTCLSTVDCGACCLLPDATHVAKC